MTSQVSLNCRYLLWRRGIPRGEWASWLGRNSSVAPDRCAALLAERLLDEHLNVGELQTLSRCFGLPEDDGTIRYADLAADGCSVLQENLRYLFNSLGHGGKRALAAKLGIDPTTISRWLNGANEPQGATVATIVSFFGLPAGTDLRSKAWFLSMDPVSSTERRRWVQARVNAMSDDDLRELFPALRRLLGER